MKKILSLLLAGVVASSAIATVASAEDYIEAVGGVKIWEWVEGNSGEEADKLFDYDETTKWCHASPYSYVIWEMPEAVEITGYQMVTANDNAEYPGRNPSAWTLYGCNDYDFDAMSGEWVEIDVVEGDEVLQDTNYTPFTFELANKAPAYKFYQLEINEIAGGSTFQMSGFNLIFDGQAAQTVKTEEEIAAEKAAAEAASLADQGYTGAVTLAKIEGITAVSGTDGASEAEGPAALFDYSTETKWCVTSGAPFEVIWEMPNAVAITGYQLATGNDTKDYSGRNPKNWTLSGSNDGSSWTAIDTKTDDATMLAANYVPFDFMLESAAPEYKFYKFECTATADDGATLQLSSINLIFDGAIADAAEEVVEAPAAEEVVEEPATEEVVEEPATEEVVEEPATEEVVEAPQTFDAAIIAGVAAVVSLAGYAISKKR